MTPSVVTLLTLLCAGVTTTYAACGESQFRCHSGTCISRDFVCDGDNKCGDWSDEVNCTCNGTSQFMCPDTDRCIPASYVCNGADDCGNSFDEQNCSSSMDCVFDIIFALDGSGGDISVYFQLMKAFVSRLVGMMDIDSGNTRMGLVIYSSVVETSFNLNTYSSVDLIQLAIRSLTYYPGTTNAAAALAYVRESMLTPAAGDRSNVSNVIILFMDGNSDNRTATQIEAEKLKEVAVDGTQTKIVSIGIIPTEDDHGIDFTEHYSIASVPLDGNVILIDSVEILQGADSVEQRILNASCSGRRGDQFQCHNTASFISTAYVCNGANSCGDWSDEMNCSCNATDLFKCPNTDRCIRASYRCNRVDECGNWDDERNCTCLEGEFHCQNYRCISAELVCDGENSCGDWSDELNCTCSEDERLDKCPNTGRCIRQTFRCDGDNDCGDWSEELTCRPMDVDVRPLFGPQAGGTLITVTGYDWTDLRQPAIAFISPSSHHMITLSTSVKQENDVGGSLKTMLVGQTPASNTTGEQLLVVVKASTWPDFANTNKHFVYRPNSNVAVIFPLSHLLSGGTAVMVTGDNVDAAAQPVITITVVVTRFGQDEASTITQVSETSERCVPFNSSAMTCTMPKVELSSDFYGSDSDPVLAGGDVPSLMGGPYDRDRADIYVGLVFDGFRYYDNLTAAMPNVKFQFYQPPTIDTLSDAIIYQPHYYSDINITGNYLQRGVRMSDYRVVIGNGTCNISFLSDNLLICRPPYDEPEPSPDDQFCDDFTSILVYAGNAGPFLHRCIRYETADGAGSDNSGLAIGLGVSLALLFIVLLIVAAVCLYKRRDRNQRNTDVDVDAVTVKMSRVPDEDHAESLDDGHHYDLIGQPTTSDDGGEYIRIGEANSGYTADPTLQSEGAEGGANDEINVSEPTTNEPPDPTYIHPF